MRLTNRNYGFVVPFVDALARLGVRHACITPGSRSAPLANAFVDCEAITTWIHHDERSSSFFGLGAAAATDLPVALVCTSGTAAAEFHPAVVEARYGRVPLIVLTADRPAELRDTGAPQTIDQINLYGSAVKWFHDIGAIEAAPRFYASAASLAARAVATAGDGPAGPVHLNFRFREPLAPEVVAGEVAGDAPAPPPQIVPGRRLLSEATLADLGRRIAGRRTLIVCGPQRDPGLPLAIAELAAAGNFPVFTDVASQVRRSSGDASRIVAAPAALAAAGFLADNPPDVVLRFGAPPTSKAYNSWSATAGVEEIVVDAGPWRDPNGSADIVGSADPTATAAALAKILEGGAPSGWTDAWLSAGTRAAAALREALASERSFSEPGVAAAVADSVPEGSILWAASSMPIRDLDLVLDPAGPDVRILANRGANGIDGFISSGLGSAAAMSRPVYLLAGDLSLLHDAGSLAAVARFDLPVTIVVINNDGGGIFHFLPHRAFQGFEAIFGTPHGLELAPIAAAFGVEAAVVGSDAALREELARPAVHPRLFEVRTDREENVAIHDRLAAAVQAAVR